MVWHSLSAPSGKADVYTHASPSKFVAGKMVNGKRVAKVMKDGTILCARTTSVAIASRRANVPMALIVAE